MAVTITATCPPAVIDDDVTRTVNNVLNASYTIFSDTVVRALNNNGKKKKGGSKGKGGVDQQQEAWLAVFTHMSKSVAEALQAERNGWREKLQSTLQEMDRQHKEFVALQHDLHDLLKQLAVKQPHNSSGKQPQHSTASRSRQPQHSTDSPSRLLQYSTESLGSDGTVEVSRLVPAMRVYIQRLQKDAATEREDHPLNLRIAKLQVSVAKLETEKDDTMRLLQEKTKQAEDQRAELDTIKGQLEQLRTIVLNYNQSHSTVFHLDEVLTASKRAGQERTYVEGDQLEYFTTSREEIALWKLRHAKRSVPDLRRPGPGPCSGKTTALRRAGVTQCLRCHQVYRVKENTALACHYHSKGREIKESYDNKGKLCNVVYTWACCKRQLDAPGCQHGRHL